MFKYIVFWLVSVHSKPRLSLVLLREIKRNFKKRKTFYYLLRWSHFLKLHILVWMCGPVQALLVTSHDLPRIWVPEPQVTEHFVQSDHGDQPSSLSSAAEQKVQKKYLALKVTLLSYSEDFHFSVCGTYDLSFSFSNFAFPSCHWS